MTKFKTAPLTPERARHLYDELAKAQAAADSFADRADLLKGQLKAAVQEIGVTDDKGSRYFTLDAPGANGVQSLKAERRSQVMLDEGIAKEILQQKKMLKRCQKTITVLDEDKLLALIYEGKVTQEERDAMYTEKVTWAFVPLKKRVYIGDGDDA